MLILSLVNWWYVAGWLKVMAAVWHRVSAILGFFSVRQLLGSLFAPFRQNSVGQRVQGSLSAQLQAFGDVLFSRIMGAIIRSMLILIGCVLAVAALIVGVFIIVVWPLLPLAPLFGTLLTVIGYMP